MKKTILELCNLTKHYGQVQALKGINLSIYEGEFIALLGPSGCGKTTLLRCIAGFLQPSSGHILIDGENVERIPPQHRPVNTVFQNYALFPHMTVEQNIAYGPKRAKWSSKKITEETAVMLDLVGLQSFGQRYPSQLSGGQQQRVALARALINRPKVLLLDEPLGALDLKLRKRMQIELKHIQQALGITFIFVTHDQEEAMLMADRIAVMNQGNIEQLGSGDELYQNPTSLFVADFIGDANIVDVMVGNDGSTTIFGTETTIPPHEACPPAGQYKMLIRPSQVELATLDSVEPLDTHVAATVEESISTGEASQIHLTLDCGTKLMAKCSKKHHDRRVSGGERVRVKLDAKNSRYFSVSR